MKTLLISSLVLMSTTIYASEVSMKWVDTQIKEIKPQRHGLDGSSLSKLKNPFIIVKPEVKDGDKKVSKTNGKKTLKVKAAIKVDMAKEPLTLQIVLNSSAFINAKWLKVNDKIRGYTLSKIQSNYVILERKNKQIKLFISQKNKNLDITSK